MFRRRTREVLSAEAVRAKSLVRGCPLAAGVWSQSDEALCSPQHWGSSHYALDHITRSLIAGRRITCRASVLAISALNVFLTDPDLLFAFVGRNDTGRAREMLSDVGQL
jgi:hypothetical protein